MSKANNEPDIVKDREKINIAEFFKNGIIENNPTFVQLLGMCPTLATSTSLLNALGMGAAATFVLICSNLVISLLRKLIPQKVRIAAYIVIIAGFVTMIDLLMQAFVPALSNSLGLFIPLIVVNCIILARAESFPSKNRPLPWTGLPWESGSRLHSAAWLRFVKFSAAEHCSALSCSAARRRFQSLRCRQAVF